jgi:glutathione S-transferase
LCYIAAATAQPKGEASMTLQLFGHPFSSYTQKALIALYENATPFEFRTLGPDEPGNGAEFAGLWPVKRFPILVDESRIILEATTVIEFLEANYPGQVTLIPKAAGAAVEVRMMDRVFDNYVMSPQQKCVVDALRAPDARDAQGVADAKAMLDTAYAWLDQRMAGREWAVDDRFSLADCAAGPALFYADWTYPIPARLTNVHAYRRRLLARPSFARAIDEARPYRAFFPLGAPNRD